MPPSSKQKRTLQGYDTFIPDPLPPRVALSTEAAQKVENATYLLGQVEMCRTLLPNANILIYSSLQREAIASSTIEGTITSPDELVRFQASHQSEHGAAREVNNYIEALEWGCRQLQKRPLAGSIMLGLHERLLVGVRGESSIGRYKDQQNYIASRPDDPIHRAVFVPAGPQEVPRLIGELEKYINRINAEARVVQCAFAHYQFETIHPFNDGNGRVGRLLIILQMIHLQLLSAPLIYPSVYFERHRTEYYRALQAVREHGEWNEWVRFFADGILQQALETIAFTQTILDLRKHLHDQIGNVGRRASLNAVLDAFFQHPVLTIADIVDRARLARHSAQMAVDTLQDHEILYEVTGKQKGRVYACRPVLDAIYASPS